MDRNENLTRRQLQCVDRRRRHYTDKEIALELGLSPATVAMHLRLARAKLRSRRRKQRSEAIDREIEELERGRPASIGTSSSWSDVLTQAAAIVMAWLSILALLVLLTKALIPTGQRVQDIARPLGSAVEGGRRQLEEIGGGWNRSLAPASSSFRTIFSRNAQLRN